MRVGWGPAAALRAGVGRLAGTSAGDVAVRVGLPRVAGVAGAGAGGRRLRTRPGGVTAAGPAPGHAARSGVAGCRAGSMPSVTPAFNAERTLCRAPGDTGGAHAHKIVRAAGREIVCQ